MGATKWPKGGF